MSLKAGFPGPAYEAASDDSSSLNHKSISLNTQAWRGKWINDQDLKSGSLVKRVVILPAAAEMSKDQRRQLRKRLREDLSMVLGLSSKLEARASKLRRQSQSYAALSDAQFSGNAVKGGGSKEVTSQLFPPTPRQQNAFSSKCSVNKRVDLMDTQNKMGQSIGLPLRKNQGFLSQCRAILKRLMSHKDGWVFNEPVDAVKLGLSDYHSVIKCPMDLGTIKTKLEKREYDSPQQFASDVRLTFNNAMTYNPPGNDVHQMADELQKLFEQLWKTFCRKFECKDARGGGATHGIAPTVTENEGAKSNEDTLSKVVADLRKSKATAKTKATAKCKALPKPKSSAKPKVQETLKREMSYEEKAQLIGSLQQLPAHVQDDIIRLMKERNPNLSQKDDEIEVDIDSFDNKTLWELDWYVKTNMKTADDSRKEAGEPSQTMGTSVPQNVNNKQEDVQQGGIDMGKVLESTIPENAVVQKVSLNDENRPSTSDTSSSESGSTTDSDSESSTASDSENTVDK